MRQNRKQNRTRPSTAERTALLALFVVLGIGLGGVLADVWDAWLFEQNIVVDQAGNRTLIVEKYGIQVVEATVWSWGIAAMVELGLVAWWIDWGRRNET